jgi:hypothetical protein
VRESSPRRARVEPHPNKDSEISENGAEPTIDATLNIGPPISNGHVQHTARGGGEGLWGAISDGTLHFTDSWMDDLPPVRGSRNPPGLDPYSWLGPLTTASPRLSVGVVRCPIWQRSNKIYSQISEVTAAVASGALQLSSAHYADMIFKAVVNGWGALNGQERSNPIMRTLRDIDQVFPQLDSISRAAFMYKSHMLLRVSLILSMHDHKLTLCSIIWIPRSATWRICRSGRGHCKIQDGSNVDHGVLILSRPSQRIRQHPIAIDFFVWYALLLDPSLDYS